MKLRKYNESSFIKNLWGDVVFPDKKSSDKYDYLYKSTIFGEILEDVKNTLDNYFVEILDRNAKTSISKVNKKGGHGFFGRYRIISKYELVKSNDIIDRANLFGNLQEDHLYLEQGLVHLKSEYKEECIFGEDFGTQTIISYEIKNMLDQNHIGFEFILDLRYD
jgi:hypothetical protein